MPTGPEHQKEEGKVISKAYDYPGSPPSTGGVWEHAAVYNDTEAWYTKQIGRYEARVYHDHCSASPGDWGSEELYMAPMGRGDWPPCSYGTAKGDEERYLSWTQYCAFHSLPWHDARVPPDDWEESEDDERRVYFDHYEEWKDSYSEAYAIFPCRYEDWGSQGSMLQQCDADEMNCAVLVSQPASKLERLGTVLSGFCPTRMAEGYVEEWTLWLSGEVYGFAIWDLEADTESGEEEMDSCWGFLGLEHCQEAADEELRHYVNEQANARMAEEEGP